MHVKCVVVHYHSTHVEVSAAPCGSRDCTPAAGVCLAVSPPSAPVQFSSLRTVGTRLCLVIHCHIITALLLGTGTLDAVKTDMNMEL